MSTTTRTPISSLGKVAFLDRLLEPFKDQKTSKIGDDAAVIDRGDYLELVASDTMLEGIDFDLEYTPLEYLGRKTVVAGISNLAAMNGVAQYITISLGLSDRFSVEEVELLYKGIRQACQEFKIELLGGNTSASMTGLTLATTTIGQVDKQAIAYRRGAMVTDLVCLSGNLGAALLGLHILEREKRATKGNPGIEPQLAKQYEYLLSRLLKPQPRIDIIESLKRDNIAPTSMIDITQGLSSAALHLCADSQVGMRIYLDRLPISSQVFDTAQELAIDPVVAALNGGDDFELLFTVPLAMHKEVMQMGGVDVIGHIVEQNCGAAIITPDGGEIAMQSPDWTSQQ